LNQRELFLRHVAQTSAAPIALEIVKAEGAVLYDKTGKEYIDLIGGISVANTGHRHPRVLQAIRQQMDAYLHVMVYGEFIESPQVQYASYLASHLPPNLNSVYFTNSGAEAVEGAMKLAKRITNRRKIVAFNNSYHGSTQGALSILGSEHWRNAFRPLLPGIVHLQYADFDSLNAITDEVACVVAETIQAEAGIITPSREWMQALRNKCTEQGVLLVLDEIQCGFGRTGRLWAFEEFDIVPDVLLLGKALGGGLPLGAFISSRERMLSLTDNPVLGHITTFGGHPLSCAAGLAAMKVLVEEKIIDSVRRKEELLNAYWKNAGITPVNSNGLWQAIRFDSFETNKKVIDGCLNAGILTDWFLFAPDCLRISPPLNINDEHLMKAGEVISQLVNGTLRM